jgi:hypothetical protein
MMADLKTQQGQLLRKDDMYAFWRDVMARSPVEVLALQVSRGGVR